MKLKLIIINISKASKFIFIVEILISVYLGTEDGVIGKQNSLKFWLKRYQEFYLKIIKMNKKSSVKESNHSSQQEQTKFKPKKRKIKSTKVPKMKGTKTVKKPKRQAISPEMKKELNLSILRKITQSKDSQSSSSIFTRIPANLFRYEVLPFIAHPREIAVIKCVDIQHFMMIKNCSSAIISKFGEIQQEMRSQKIHPDYEALSKAMELFSRLSRNDFLEMRHVLKPPPVWLKIGEIIV